MLAAFILAGSAPALQTVYGQGAQAFDVAGTDENRSLRS